MLIALACSLSLLAAAEKPLQLKLPAGTVGPTKYQHAQLIAALIVGGRTPVPIVLLWDDGRVLWSENALTGGVPYRTGFVTPARAAALTERFKGHDPALLTKESLGPDASYASLILRLSGGRYAQMKSWHPRGPDAKTLATSRGLEPRNGRDPAAVLAADVPAYQAFRRLWQDLEDELVSVAHTATRAAPVSPKLEWDWARVLSPAPTLTMGLELDGERWRFFVEGATKSTFPTVEALRAFLAQQLDGTRLIWDPGCKRVGNEPLLQNEKDLAAFKAFCAEHGIELVILPGG